MNNKILLPLLRKHVPIMIANDIVGVQPMSMMPQRWKVVSESTETVPKGYLVIDTNSEIGTWVEAQALYMWKHGITQPKFGFFDRYIISEELLSWLTVRWA